MKCARTHTHTHPSHHHHDHQTCPHTFPNSRGGLTSSFSVSTWWNRINIQEITAHGINPEMNCEVQAASITKWSKETWRNKASFDLNRNRLLEPPSGVKSRVAVCCEMLSHQHPGLPLLYTTCKSQYQQSPDSLAAYAWQMVMPTFRTLSLFLSLQLAQVFYLYLGHPSRAGEQW